MATVGGPRIESHSAVDCASRVLGIALAMGVILLLSEIWRRITFRYISDVRRRRQFLLLRRIVIGFCMGIVLILGFVSEFSSLATFAGFITAGLAVGLQTILLSVAAYFFLVGRWGIRVGDRISVAGVTGDVVDVGLVRLYLMELAGTGVDLYPDRPHRGVFQFRSLSGDHSAVQAAAGLGVRLARGGGDG